MLQPLTTQFNILGNGFEALRQIRDTFSQLRKNFKQGEIENKGIFGRMGKSASDFFRTIKSGTVRVGNGFKAMAARSELFLNKVKKSGTGLYGTLTKIAAVFGGGMLFKKAFDSATSVETMRNAIESMRGSKRAEELMNFGVRLANITPYTANEVLGGVQKLELRDLDPTKYLTGIGDMAAMLGKPLEQAVEAVLSARVGNFESLKQFGITKGMIEKLSPKSFKGGSLINQEQMFEDLMNYINKTYQGGMNKLAKTTAGVLSTIQGITESFLGMIFSGSQTGKIVEGSPLYVLNEEVLQPLAANLEKWQEDGTFERWSRSFASGIRSVASAVKETASFIKEYKNVLLGLLAIFVGFKVLISIATAIVAVNTAFQTLGATFLFLKDILIFIPKILGIIAGAVTSTAGLVVIAIAGIIAIWVILYKKVEWFRDLVHKVFDIIKWDIGLLIDFFGLVTQGVQKFIDWVGRGIDKVMELWGKVKSVFSGAADMMKLPEGGFKTSFEYDAQGNFIGDTGTITNNKTNEIKTINEKATNITINVDGTNQGVVEEAIEKAMYKRDLREGK